MFLCKYNASDWNLVLKNQSCDYGELMSLQKDLYQF